VVAREVVVTQDDWADYVFHDDYELASLNDVAKHIGAHGHLPGVPKAAEIVRDGLPLGDTQALLLEKIEELMLYTIDQSRALQEQRESARGTSRSGRGPSRRVWQRLEKIFRRCRRVWTSKRR